MTKERDFDMALCKVPRKDKDGNDISSDKIGKGGRHRKDGTYSGTVYDIEVIEESSLFITDDYPISPVEYEEKRQVQHDDLPCWGHVIVDVAEEVMPIIIDELIEIASDSFNNWLQKRRQKKVAEQSAKVNTIKYHQKVANKHITKAELIMQESIKKTKCIKPNVTTSIYLPVEFDTAYEQYNINMTSEEAQKELLDAFVLYLLSAKKMWNLAHAKIIDNAGSITNGQEIIEKLSATALIDNINLILESNPTLIDRWQMEALNEILGHELILDSIYVPIREQELKLRLMELQEK